MKDKVINLIEKAIQEIDIESFANFYKANSENTHYAEDGIYLYDVKISQELHKYILSEDLASTYKTIYLRFECGYLVLNAENVEETRNLKYCKVVVFKTEDDLERSRKKESGLSDKIYSLECLREESQKSYSNLLKENECMREQLEKLLLLCTKNKFIEDASFVEEYLNSILEKE